MPSARRPLASVARAALFALASLNPAACAGIGHHGVSTLAVAAPAAPRRFTTWEEVFASPTALDVTAYVTGRIEVGADVLIDAGDPHTPATARGRQWVPALSYLVTRPDGTRFLMDTGLPQAGANGRCDYGIEPFFHAPCRAARDQDVASQLHRDGVATSDLAFALISHLHGDHAGGLARLAAGGRLVVAVAREEWDAARRDFRALDGYLGGQLEAAFDVATLPPERAVEMPIVGRAWDLFGDASVWVFLLPGHTRGELAVLLNTTSEPLLFTFDVSHLRANFDNAVAPGFTVDRDAARANIRRLIAFHAAHPRVRVIYGHEPAQWPDEAVSLPLVNDIHRPEPSAPAAPVPPAAP